jgi:predicted secreted protein
MTGFIGREVKFFWGGNSPADEIAGVREKSVAISGAGIDVTADDSSGWRELLSMAAIDEVSINISGVTKDRRLKTDWFNGTRTQTATLEYPDGTIISGTFFLQSFTDTGSYNNAMTFQAAVVSTGVVSYTPGTP